MTAYYLPHPSRVGYDRQKAQQDGSKNDAPVTIPQERLTEFQIAGVAEPGATAIPADAIAGDLTLTCLPGYGWAAIVPGDYEGRPETSDVNLAPDHPVTVSVPVAFAGGRVRVWSSGGMQCFIDVKKVERPFDRGLGGAWGVAGYWTPAQAAHVGVRRFQNWGRDLDAEQARGVRAGELLFYPTFLAEQRDWSVEQARADAQRVVDQISYGQSYIIGNEPEHSGISAAEFAGRFKRIAEGIMQADPSAKIVGPSIMWYGQDPAAKAWFWDFIGQGTAPLMHKIGVHSYTAHYQEDADGNVRYWLCDPAGMMAELWALRRDCDAHPWLAGKAIVDSEASMIHAEGPAGLPPEHPLVVAEARHFFGEFLPALRAELDSLNVEALLVFQSAQAKWNDKMYVYNPVGMVDAQGQWTEYASALLALARS